MEKNNITIGIAGEDTDAVKESVVTLFNQSLATAGIKRENCISINKADMSKIGSSINPNIVIALGNQPLEYLTNETSITKWRGSILSYNEVKIIPTFHPGSCQKQWNRVYILARDLKIAKKESEFPELVRRERTSIINPSFDQAMSELERLEKEEYLCLDLETFMKRPIIKCIGLGSSNDRAICIPFVRGFKLEWTKQEEGHLWYKIRSLLTNPDIKKIAQNAQFELTQLLFLTQNKMWIWLDTMRAHALVYPEFPHGLDFLTSIYTDMIYYKDEGKTSSGSVNYDQLQLYNCKDIFATFEAAMKLNQELKDRNMYNFYHEYDNPLMHSLFNMQTRGVKIDQELMASHKDRLEKEIEELHQTIDDDLGYHINPKSFKDMPKYLYETLGLPKQYNTVKGKKKITTDEKALLKLAKRYPEAPHVTTLLEIRQKRTLKENFLEMKLSEDGKIRTSYGLTATGRLSSSMDVFDIGANLQNIPKRKGKWMRSMFIPDEGKVFVIGDLKQAEAMLIAWFSGDINYKSLFKSGRDVHKLYASLLYSIDFDDVTESQRSDAKNLRHGKNYAMGAKSLAEHLGVDMKRAKELSNEDDKMFPNVKSVYYTGIEEQLSKNRTLITPLGRKRTFLDRWGQGLFRKAYNYKPQSTVGDIINLALVRLDNSLPIGAEVLMQVHDELVIQCYPKQVPMVAEMLKKEAEIPLLINGEYITIPIEIEWGNDWLNTKEVKDDIK